MVRKLKGGYWQGDAVQHQKVITADLRLKTQSVCQQHKIEQCRHHLLNAKTSLWEEEASARPLGQFTSDMSD